MKHKTPVSDTDDTGDEFEAGEMKFYSHGKHSLTHQHWLLQFVSAGGLNVHDVQGPEAAHKINMHLASLRVRHRGYNQTQDAMLKFGLDHTLFNELRHMLRASDALVTTTRKKPRPKSPAVYMPICFDSNFTGPGEISDHFLHADIRLQEREVACIICQKLMLPQTAEGFEHLRSLKIVFGRKLVRRDGREFFATDDRRDMLSLDATAHGGNALCGEAICFVSIDNVKSISADYAADSHSYALIRWLQPHPDSWERDTLGRPVCPGPLLVNNCLWEYSNTPRPRRAMVSARDVNRPSLSFIRHKHFFGATANEQNSRRRQEQSAFYALVRTDTIKDTLNMCQCFQNNSSTFDCQTWLQTVVVE